MNHGRFRLKSKASPRWKLVSFSGARVKRPIRCIDLRLFSDIEDPFEPVEEEDLRWHVEENARISPYETSKRTAVRSSLERYVRVLLGKLLSPNTFSSSEHQLIWELNIVGNNEFSSFERLHWELLEDLVLWPPSFSKPLSVIVHRTYTNSSAFSSRPNPRDSKRILIITSRPKGHRDVPGRLVSLPVFKLIGELRQQEVDVDAEIVRPGTWQAAKEHLLDRCPGYFDLVHFDVHGCVENST